ELCMRFIEHLTLDKVRWINPENWHITLVFLGSFPVDKVQALTDNLEEFFTQAPSFNLFYDRYSYKPGFKNPTMIWANFQHSEEFDKLVISAYSHLSDFYTSHEIPFKLSIREHNIPHITLARLKQEYNPFPKLQDTKKDFPVLQVKDCHLFESALLPKGAKYHLLHSFSLMQFT
ncbi:RNA 2',3'-cyclic phosphodiesterase, partial [Bacteroidota bacterium]